MTPRARRQHPRAASPAFTLIELLVTMAIIVLIVAMAVPMFGFMTGSRSIGSAKNQISAMLQRARMESMGLQRPEGLAFFVQPGSGRVAMALVAQSDPRDARYYDVLPDTEILWLPPGVGMRLVNDDPNNRYVANGLILFDGKGRLTKENYEFKSDGLYVTKAGGGVVLSGQSQLGFVLYDREAFENAPDEAAWLDANADVVAINRYNGTLIGGQQ